MLLTLALSGWLAIPPRASTSPAPGFSTMSWELHNLPRLATYTARDCTHRAYHTYTAESGKILILLHGAGSDSRSLHTLGHHLAAERGAMVVVPDLRGHGLSPEPITSDSSRMDLGDEEVIWRTGRFPWVHLTPTVQPIA